MIEKSKNERWKNQGLEEKLKSISDITIENVSKI